jgi:mRNA interferase MazF
VRRGDIYLCDLGDPVDPEQGYRRPVVIVSHDQTIDYGLPIVVPMTRSKRGYPTHVEIEGVLPVTSYAQCEQIRAIAANRLTRHLGTIDAVDLLRIEGIIRRLLGP